MCCSMMVRSEHGRATASPVYDDNDELVEYVPANYVVGFGAIDGRQVTVGGEDFTLKGGSPNAAGLRKSVYAEHLAVQYRTPLVRMLEGGGGSVKGGGKKGGTVGEPVYTEPRFKIIADAMGVVPVASAALGAVAGFSRRPFGGIAFLRNDRTYSSGFDWWSCPRGTSSRGQNDKGRAGRCVSAFAQRHRRQFGC